MNPRELTRGIHAAQALRKAKWAPEWMRTAALRREKRMLKYQVSASLRQGLAFTMDLSKFTEVTNEEVKRELRKFLGQFSYSVPGPVVARVVRLGGDPDGTMRAVLRTAHAMQRDPLDDPLFDPFVNQGGKPS